MSETDHLPQMIVVLVQHPVLGYLLIPYIAVEEDEHGTLRLQEQAFHASPDMLSRLSGSELKVIEIASVYTEKKLMRVYSKEKTTAEFFKKITDRQLKESIRPFIEKRLVEVLEIIRREKLPLYQHKAGGKKLYKHDLYKTPSALADVTFHFEMADGIFRYSISCTEEGEPISLTEKKPVITLISNPAVLLTGAELHQFKDIEASRILPFTNRQTVSVDASHIDKYLEKIVMPVASHHSFTYRGMPVVEEQRKCEAILSIESTIFQEMGLKLTFRYGEHTFYPGKTPGKAEAYLSKQGNDTLLYYYHRDHAFEQQAMQTLTALGLKLIDYSHFVLTKEASTKGLVRWIQENKGVLQETFLLINAEKNAPYCLSDIIVEQKVAEENDWLELHITVIIGEFRIPFVRFRKNIIEGIREYMLPNEELVLLPEEWFSKYADLFAFSEKKDDRIRVKRHFVGIVQGLFEESGKEKIFYREKSETEAPRQLKTKLRDYQKEGFNWMLYLSNHGFGGCLADDMGLGKTIQTLALLQYIYDSPEKCATPAGHPNDTGQLSLFPVEAGLPEKPASLIIVPTSLLHNWKREIERFTTLSVLEYTGSTRYADPENNFGRFNLILTSYGMVRNNPEMWSKYHFEYIVLDESQHIKNSESLTFKTVIQLQGRRRLTLTGTPIENSLKDLWSQFHFFHPGLLGSEQEFNRNFILPIKQGNERIQERLQKLISPFILRRNKQEVAPELPSLTEETIYCEMEGEQAERYRQEKNKLRNAIFQLGVTGQRYKNLTVLNGITLLRQLASHPRMVFPDFTDTPGKLEEVINVFETLQSEGHKVLIFSSFVKHLDLVAEAFTKRGWEYAKLTGSTVKREEEIERFSTNSHIKAFLISLKAGGVGLNLTDADYIFILDPWWNPAAEMQAISRAHRIGQDKHVFAYRFITQNSIEEKIIHLQESKRKLSETFITDNNPWQALTDEDWEKLME